MTATYKSIVDDLPILCWVAHADGFIYWFNKKWYEYTGTRPDEMTGWGWQSVHDPIVLPNVMINWKHAIETGEPFEMVFPLRSEDGNYNPFLTLVNPKMEDGKVVAWYGVNINISKQVDAEQRLSACNRRNIEIMNGLVYRIGKKIGELK